MTKEERLDYQRKRRLLNNNADTKRYEKTQRGFIMRLYRNIESRISGVQKQKHHLYIGKELSITREELHALATTSTLFQTLWNTWVESKYDRKLTPSLDRINSNEGYTISNVEWVTHSENSRRGATGRRKKDSGVT